ncbi:MAG: cysteine hydrolase family protein [Terriglobales bacterium]
MIIDLQVGLVRLVPPELEDRVLSNVAVLLRKSRSSGAPVLFVQHDGPKGHPLEAETAAWAIHSSILPMKEERVIRKKASDSFFETRLAEELQKDEISHLIIVGGMTEYCVDTTCRRAVTLGYDVTLVADAHLTSDTPVLTAAQTIAHHNLLLDGFAAGVHSIQVKPADEIFL